jgi:hypothetical protein
MSKSLKFDHRPDFGIATPEYRQEIFAGFFNKRYRPFIYASGYCSVLSESPISLVHRSISAGRSSRRAIDAASQAGSASQYP